MRDHHILLIKVATLLITFILVVLATKPSSAQSYQDNWNTNLKLDLGTKQLNKGDWGIVSRQMAFGVDADFYNKKWSFSLVTGFIHSQGKEIMYGVKNVGQTDEFILGIRKGWGSSFRLYLTGGASIINARVKGLSGNKSGTGAGFMADAGIYIPFKEHFNIGFLCRYSYAQTDIEGTSAKLGGVFFLFSFGYQW
jgi:hypothetical protein